MPKDIFDTIEVKDIFDTVNLDLFDKVELSVEDKVIYSRDMESLVREAIQKEIANIPLGKIISRIMEKEVAKQKEAASSLIKRSVSNETEQISSEMDTKIKELKHGVEDFFEKMKKKYDDFRNEAMSQPRYEFGGFSPLVNDLNIGDPATEGSWRIVRSGSNLSVQRLESSVWVEKGSFLP